MSRFSYQLFRIIQDIHNVTFFVFRATSWGINQAARKPPPQLKNNGSNIAAIANSSSGWNGAIGFLTRGEVDVCITPLRLSPERFGHFEATTYVYHVHVQFLFRHPKASLAGSNVFLQPFVSTVWFVIVAIALASAALMRHMLRADDRIGLGDRDDQSLFAAEAAAATTTTAVDSTWSGSFLMIFGIFLQQGYETVTRLLATRIAALSSLFLALMLFQFYGAFIVGSLLMQAPKTIRSMAQLLASPLDCGIDRVVYLEDIFNHLVDPTEVQLYRQKVLARGRQHGLLPWLDGLEAVKRGGYAFAFSDISRMYSALRGEMTDAMICELQEIQVSKAFACPPAVANRSPWQELIKIEYVLVGFVSVLYFML